MGFNVSIQPRLFPIPQTAFTSDDYWTPRWIFETLGLRFDLDVAAPPGGSPHVPADRYYTQADDGLAAPWFGRVWMNPPYSRASPWVDRFISHSNGVALLPHSKAKWHIRLFEQADAICAPTSGYFPFDSPRPGGGAIFFPVFFAAFGFDCCEAVGRLGTLRVRERNTYLVSKRTITQQRTYCD